ncbi:MAG: ABC transporter ATP-binding protein [Betaproteobacteria bacterium]|nr:ABC transporter ATP-binding protein [Betaproteobacteria bacterium]
MSPRLELRAITKRWPSVVANDAVSLEVMPGEIHALLGENGAGKSTLMKILYGVIQADAGEIVWEGRAVRIASPAEARRLGIGMVFQHFSLFETLTVVENIALGLGDGSALDPLAERITEVSGRYGLPIDPHRIVHALSVGERQRVEIVRCLLQQPRLLIMDEPTSVLSPQAVDSLFDTLRTIAAEGCSVMYISHKLDEIRSLCHRATVLRGGQVSARCTPAQETHESLARMMIGGDLPEVTRRSAPEASPVRLALHALTMAPEDPFGTALDNVSLQVRSGEIVGIAGVSGNGQQELIELLSGERLAENAGSILIEQVPAGRLDVSRRRALGLATIVEERLGRGAVPALSLVDNALLTTRGSMLRGAFIDRRALAAFARQCIERFSVRCRNEQAPAGSLSGGNLQRFIVGREILQNPRVLVVAQPTWGVDVGAAAFIRQSLVNLRDAGCAILVVSEDLDELFEVSDRIAVLAGGRLSKAFPAADLDAAAIGVMMGATHRRTGNQPIPQADSHATSA